MDSVVSSRERLSFTGFIAIVVHAVIILGVSFSVYNGKHNQPTLEVTLAQHAESTAPEQADYLAQHNQEASGTLDEKAELTTDRRADFADTVIRDVNTDQHKQKTVADNHPDKQHVTTTAPLAESTVQDKKDDQPEEEVQEGEDEQDSPVNNEIASLQARLAQERQQYAKRPRIKTLTSVAARTSVEAEYLNLWQEKIELIGNAHYPEEARQKKLYGELRVLVSLLPDGRVQHVDILQSSGYPVLDEAVNRIVRFAAPFPPFPPELRKNVDQLEIIRTWKFERGDKLISQ
ncbi:MAG TPA: TonB family protein [Pseudomonadales bacterium]|nr:TonB family protein [Pseudomonadales bacterium]